ncbi:hypothetical protein SAMN05443244_0824 [Terriglobus roseus]|uniref:Heparinase II/III-like protein n=2 Tax=Terriglobus roseus TaxID=392734 RepID=A0A1H4JUA0_9BACT|nr:hypothetical protein SAMN05443244_0824 [Terriglobus roseus]
MGYPAIDPHSLGSWNGVAIACMAFYDELPVARHALPFFHGLLMDSLQLFPDSGKAAWATYFPFHMVLYLAAACTFGGALADVDKSLFLDNLGWALLTSFASPNSQELQRGLRTREHRFLTAFLYRFHPTPEIAAIYRTFVQQERQSEGDVWLGMFDLLYAPQCDGPTARMPHNVLFAQDIGDVIANSESQPQISISMSAGAKAGRRASFTLMPQNREFAPSMGAFEVAVDGAPVLININISCYGINSALTNTLCLEEGGGVTNGQYLNGAVRPDQCSVMRRYLAGDRFVCANVVMTHAMDPKLHLEMAERLFLFDRHTGTIVVADSFAARCDLKFATHLHCAGSAHAIEDDLYRLTGGQANRIAGIKGGSKGMGDEEKGELYVRVLRSSAATRIVTEEPAWIPGYIYGVNHTGQESLSDAQFPRYTRWRLEQQDRSTSGEMVYALSPRPDMLTILADSIQLPGGGMQVGLGQHEIWDVRVRCECLLWDDATELITALGVSQLVHKGRSATFDPPIDLEYIVSRQQGRLFASTTPQALLTGFVMGSWSEANTQASHGRFASNLNAAAQANH